MVFGFKKFLYEDNPEATGGAVPPASPATHQKAEEAPAPAAEPKAEEAPAAELKVEEPKTDSALGDINEDNTPALADIDKDNSALGDINEPKTEPKKDEPKKVETTNDEGEAEEFEVSLSENSPLSADQFNKIVDFTESKNLTKEETENFIKLQEASVMEALNTERAEKARISREKKQKVLNDPEFGGAKWEESKNVMALPVNAFGDDDLIQLMKSDFGSEPAFARFIYRLGNAMKSDSFHGKGGNPHQQESNKLKKLYPGFFEKA